MSKKWYAFYTHSRAEKKAKVSLEKAGFEVFLPLMKTVRQWSDRKKKVEVPLFNSYLFVLGNEHQIPDILKNPGVAWNIRHNGQPAVLREKEKLMIERLISSEYNIGSVKIDKFEPYDKVRIVEGPVNGMEGLVLRNNPNSVIILVDSISLYMKFEVDPSILVKIG